MITPAAECLFLFVDVQYGFTLPHDRDELVPQIKAFHRDLTELGLPVWHVHMRDQVHPDRQAGVDRMQAPLVEPAAEQAVFAKNRMAPDTNPAFAQALLAAKPRLIVACGFFFDKCVTATVAHSGMVLGTAGHDCKLAIVDGLCAPGFHKDQVTRRRWLGLQCPAGMQSISRRDLQLDGAGVTLPDGEAVRARPPLATARRTLTP